MRRTVYHLFIKDKKTNKFYGSLKAITDANSHEALGIGRDSLYRFDWSGKYENTKITIEKSELLTTNDVKKKPVKKKK